MKCPQCESTECGSYVCRFTGITQHVFRTNQYAQAMIKRDAEEPKWLRELRQGARDIPVGQ